MAKNITKGKIGNALASTANDHVVAVANDIYDETLDKYQSQINDEVEQSVFVEIYDPEEEIPQPEFINVEDANYAYNWKSTDGPARDGKTEGNLKDLYQKTLSQDWKLSELESEVNNVNAKVLTGEKTLNLNFVDGYYDGTGSVVHVAWAKRTDAINVADVDIIIIDGQLTAGSAARTILYKDGEIVETIAELAMISAGLPYKIFCANIDEIAFSFNSASSLIIRAVVKTISSMVSDNQDLLLKSNESIAKLAKEGVLYAPLLWEDGGLQNGEDTINDIWKRTRIFDISKYYGGVIKVYEGYANVAYFDINKSFVKNISISKDTDIEDYPFIRIETKKENQDVDLCLISSFNQSSENFSKRLSILEDESNTTIVNKPIYFGDALSSDQKSSNTYIWMGSRLGNGIRKVNVEVPNGFRWYVSEYKDKELTRLEVNGKWHNSSGVALTNINNYLIIQITTVDGRTLTSNDLKSVSVSAYLNNDNAVNILSNITYTRFNVEFGNPFDRNNLTRAGNYLNKGIVGIKVDKLPEGIKWSVSGYNEDFNLKQRYYSSPWMGEFSSLIFKDERTLKYVISFTKDDATELTYEDLKRIEVYAYRTLDNSFVSKGFENILPITEIPQYYYEGRYIQEKVSVINSLMKGCVANGDAFMFVTDEHWYWNAGISPNLIRYIKKNTTINKLIDGGDRYDGYNIDATTAFIDAMENGKFYPVVGNHEIMLNRQTSSSQTNTPSDIYASSFMHLSDNPQVVWGEKDKFYYYVDNQIQKIRYIFLQSFEATEDGTSIRHTYSNQQIEWFKNIASNVEDGWTMIIITHSIILGNDATKTFVLPDKSFESWAYGYYEMFSAIKNYNGKGIIAAVIQGHTHWDADGVIDGVKNQIPLIITTCDRYVSAGEYPQEDRLAGTITEQAFDVVVLDKEQKKLSFVRIGAPAEKVINGERVKVEMREFSYFVG